MVKIEKYNIVSKCKDCFGYDSFCKEYIATTDKDKLCLYHHYRKENHSSLFQWKQDMGKLEKLCSSDIGD